MSRSTLHVLTPTYKPVGGVVKIFDYVSHALSFGYRVSVWSPQPFDADLPLFAIDRFRELADHPDVEYHSRDRLVFRERDLAFVSLPKNYEVAYRSLPSGMSPERIIHFIQNVRHVNPHWGEGYPLRLLTRPAARISMNPIVADTIAPWLDPRGLHRTIHLGHDVAYFAGRRSGPLHAPVRVAHTAWKSDIGDRTEAALQGDPGFTFRAIRETVPWSDLRELYSWADVFLCAPHAEEGMYLPGVEAMAAGCLVVTADAGGNMAYSHPGENCLLAEYDDAEGYAAALRRFAGMPEDQVARFRAAGHEATAAFGMERERDALRQFLDVLWDRIDAFEGAEDAAARRRATDSGRGVVPQT